MHDTQAPAATAAYYQSSKGQMLIADMAYPHIVNAIAKMEREGRTDDTLTALCQRRDKLDAERAEAEGNAPVADAVVGHNGAPVTPFDTIKTKVDDLRLEAGNWLDGAEIENQAQADEIGKMLDMVRRLKTEAEAAKTAEKKPFMDAANEVQARYNTLTGETKAQTGLLITIEQTIKATLSKWLRKVAAEQEAARQEALRIEREAAAKAQEAIAHTHDTSDIEDREAALRDVDVARQAAIDLAAANKQKAQAQGGERAIGLRTVYRPEIVKLSDALKHYWMDRPDAFTDLVMQFARDDIRAGKRSGIPGVDIISEQVV